ncbi:MAG: cystathionine gamma-synthase family protein [Chitinophagales bacterium]|jgi:methionine-gamma-lyase|nr:cystathionine gamma-synthase family protein [Bacteroidota bacterium]MBP8916361.1 cystathionine gamma-synthase family protein [Chitinophagales bacterium]MBP9220750.1 cystathionine gamma-synthase family protein [Chitinophagales bacterium]MBP9795166.1 cystathionine gamma-synthase family protein [Chitinophagales bacterium]
MEDHKMHPESLMMSFGYKPELSEGAIKCPIFQTSTFVFKTAEAGKRFFEVAYGLSDALPGEEQGLIYSRLNNPDIEILENRLTLWDKAEACTVFSSGMSAISTVLLEFLKPGDTILYSSPIYGGTDHFIKHVLPTYGIKSLVFDAHHTKEEILDLITKEKVENLNMIYIETPANPTNALIDIEMCSEIGKQFSNQNKKVTMVVDNTYMGPLWSHPLQHGADLVVYSATKYIGGHSDVIAGAVLGSAELIRRIKVMRTFMGNMMGPWSAWLLLRSLETLKARMQMQEYNAMQVAKWLQKQKKVEKIFYLGMLEEGSVQHNIWKKQYSSFGAMISFTIKGGEKEAFTFLNNLKLIKLAVSLGSTESLAEHPASMTHADVSLEEKNRLGISDSLVRISIGVEHFEDIIWDIEQAFEKVEIYVPDLIENIV